jgi:hypothetical protein
MVGYKALNANYSQGSGLTLYNFDMTIHGPTLGLTARFLIPVCDTIFETREAIAPSGGH